MNQNFLDKHKKIHYLGKGLKNINNDVFVNRFIELGKDPYSIQIVYKGTENRGKIVMLITNNYPLNGFFAEFMDTLKLLAYADRFGFEPYILYKNDFLYFEEGDTNAFDEYFVQPTQLTLNSVNHSCNLFEASLFHSYLFDVEHAWNPGKYLFDQKYINDLALVMQKYIKLNEFTESYIRDSIGRLFGENKKILGVHHRETDFKAGYRKHPSYISVEEKMSEIDLIQDKYDLIFIATDSKNAIDKFTKRWPDKVVYYTDVYRSDGDVSVAFCDDDRKNHKHLLGFEVLRDMYTLARCDGLIAGISKVSICAQITKKKFNQDYEYIKILDNGINQTGKYFGK